MKSFGRQIDRKVGVAIGVQTPEGKVLEFGQILPSLISPAASADSACAWSTEDNFAYDLLLHKRK